MSKRCGTLTHDRFHCMKPWGHSGEHDYRIQPDKKTYTQAELDSAVQAATETLHKIIQQQNIERVAINEENQRNYNAATERMSCSHVKADWVPAKGCDRACAEELAEGKHHIDCAANWFAYCRTCAENLAAIATAMVQQRETCAIAINKCYRQADGWARQSEVEAAILNTPLVSAPAQEWLERQLAAARLAEAKRWNHPINSQDGVSHTQHTNAFYRWCEECRDERISKLEAELRQQLSSGGAK